jgi:hypothetical protein
MPQLSGNEPILGLNTIWLGPPNRCKSLYYSVSDLVHFRVLELAYEVA